MQEMTDNTCDTYSDWEYVDLWYKVYFFHEWYFIQEFLIKYEFYAHLLFYLILKNVAFLPQSFSFFVIFH